MSKVVYGFVTLDSIPTDPHFKAARQAGAIECIELDEGMFYLGSAGRVPAGALPPHPGRPGLRRDGGQPLAAHGGLALRRRRGAGGRPRPPPGRRPGPRQPGRRQGIGPDPRARSLLRRTVPRRGRPPVRDHRAHRGHRPVRRRGTAPDPVHQPPADRRRGRDPGGRPLHRLCPRLLARRGVPEGVRGRRRRSRRLDGVRRAVPRGGRARLPGGRGPGRRGAEARIAAEKAATGTKEDR